MEKLTKQQIEQIKDAYKKVIKNGSIDDIKADNVITLFNTPLIIESFDGWLVECHSVIDSNEKYSVPLPFINS